MEALFLEKTQKISQHIETQNFSSPPNLYLQLLSEDDLVAIFIAKKLMDRKSIGTINLCTFDTPEMHLQNTQIYDIVKNLGINVINMEISTEVDQVLDQIMDNLLKSGFIDQQFKTILNQSDQSHCSEVRIKLEDDMYRGILYSMALRNNGIVLSNINKDYLEIGLYSKTNHKVGDWNFVGDLTLKQIFNIIKEFEPTKDLIFDSVDKFILDYYFDENYEMLPFDKLSDDAKYYLKNWEHKKNFPPLPININGSNNEVDDINDINDINNINFVKIYKSEYELSGNLLAILNQLRDEEKFSAKKWVDNLMIELFELFKTNGKQNVTFGISGGIDSSLVLALMDYLFKLYPDLFKFGKIIPVGINIDSTDEIQQRAYDLCKHMNIPYVGIDFTETHKSLCNKIHFAMSLSDEQIQSQKFTDGCFKSSLRANVLYCVSRIIENTLVVGTGNKSEDGYLHYYAKSGDGLNDVSPIGSLYKHNVYMVAQYLGIIESILLAKPSADLVKGQTDEGELGFSYDFVELHMRLNETKRKSDVLSKLDLKSKQEFIQMEAKMFYVHEKNKHKSVLAKII